MASLVVRTVKHPVPTPANSRIAYLHSGEVYGQRDHIVTIQTYRTLFYNCYFVFTEQVNSWQDHSSYCHHHSTRHGSCLFRNV